MCISAFFTIFGYKRLGAAQAGQAALAYTHTHTHTHTKSYAPTHSGRICTRAWFFPNTSCCMHIGTCLPTLARRKPELHPHGASHEHFPSGRNTTSCSNNPQLHPKGTSHEHTPVAPLEGQKNKPQLHPSGASRGQYPAKDSASNKLHPTGASLEHQHERKKRETISLSCIPQE